MQYKREDFEIMAPAGSYESLYAAIQSGANSVYFGIDKLNMRSRSASNFNTDDLREIVRICKENNIKSYLTLNTVCLLYTSDAADDLLCVDLGGSRIIKKKKTITV